MNQAKALRIAMQHAGMTVTALAEKLDVTQGRISQWRTGSYNMSHKAAQKLEEMLDCDAAWLSGAACR